MPLLPAAAAAAPLLLLLLAAASPHLSCPQKPAALRRRPAQASLQRVQRPLRLGAAHPGCARRNPKWQAISSKRERTNTSLAAFGRGQTLKGKPRTCARFDGTTAGLQDGAGLGKHHDTSRHDSPAAEHSCRQALNGAIRQRHWTAGARVAASGRRWKGAARQPNAIPTRLMTVRVAAVAMFWGTTSSRRRP